MGTCGRCGQVYERGPGGARPPGLTSFYLPAANCAHVGTLAHSGARAAEIPPAPGPNQAWNSKGSLAKLDLPAALQAGKKPEASQGTELPLLFELLSRMHFSQNNLIIYFL